MRHRVIAFLIPLFASPRHFPATFRGLKGFAFEGEVSCYSQRALGNWPCYVGPWVCLPHPNLTNTNSCAERA